MDKVINLEILGHPINIFVIVVAILLWWLGAFAVFGLNKPSPAST